MKKEMEIEKIYSLSPMQKGMLFHYLKDENSTAYSEQRLFTLEGDIDPDRLEKSIRFLVDRYDVFRTVFRYEKVKQPLQIVFKKRKFNLHFEDISQMPGEKQGKYLEDIKKYQRQKGFDFKKDLLIRVFLFKTGTNNWKLLWSYHHIIMDGWCVGIIFNQLIQVYNALRQGKPVQSKPTVPYREYIRWLKKQDPEQGVLYWREYLDGCDRQASLLGPAKPGAHRQYRLKEHRFIIRANLKDRMNQLAIKNQATLFTLLQTAWGILLQKYNDTDDVVFGTVVSGRPPEIKGVGDMVGLFVNTIPLRIQTKEKQDFQQLLEQVQQKTLSSRSYEYLPLAEVQSHSALKEHLIDHIMVYENYPLPGTQEATSTGSDTGFRVTHMEFHEQTGYDLNVLVIPGKDLGIVFNYNASVYETDFLEKTANRFLRLLKEVTENPGQEIGKIEITSAEEKKQILLNFNDTRREYPKDKTIHTLFAEQAQLTPDQIAVVGVAHELHELLEISPSEGTGGLAPLSVLMSITYKELNEKSHQLAHVLRDKGVKPDTIVAIMGERSLEMIIGILGILKTGGAYLPIDPDYPPDRINYILDDSGAKILATTRVLFGEIEKVRRLVVKQILIGEDLISAKSSWDSPLERGGPKGRGVSKPVTNPKNLAYILYTSGTSGWPRGVMVEHRNVVRLVKNTNYIRFQPGQKVLQTGPLEFDASTFEIWGPLLNGGILYEIPRQELLMPQTLGNRIKRFEIDTMWMTAPLFNRMVEADIKIFTGIKNLLVGGDALSPPHINRVKQCFPCLNVINGYGPTENTTFSTTFRLDREYESNIPIGKPIANSAVYILDRNFKFQPIGVVGELVVGGDGVSRGYLNDPRLTSEKFLSVFSRYYRSYMSHMSYIYKTGDLARWLADGNIQFLGRADQQVKIRGFRIELKEIEIRLLQHRNIKEAVVTAGKDKQADRYLCAYIVFKREDAVDETALPLELKNHLSRQLPDYMVPAYFVPLQRIPLTPNGKVNRGALPVPQPPVGETIRPRDETENKLLEIWQEVLDLETAPGIDDNFFHLGGHSLKAMLLISYIGKTFNTEISLTRIFKAPSIRSMAAFIQGTAKNIYTDIRPVSRRDYYLQSSAQKRLFFLDQFEDIGTSYNMPMVFKVTGKIDFERFGKAFASLIQRHETLRTSFHMKDNEAVQRVHDRVDFEIEYNELKKVEVEEQEVPFGQVLDAFGGNYPKSQELRAKSYISSFIRPFDLSQAPLLRIGLVTLNTKEYLLLFDMHHIIGDGTSMGLIMDEFTRLYQGEELPYLRIRYKDFTHWQNRMFASGRIKAQQDYWQGLYPDPTAIPCLDLPTDFPRPDTFTFAGDRFTFTIEEQDALSFRKLAIQNNVTLYMNLLAAFNLLLFKYTGQQDIVVGSGIFGRPRAELQKVIGMFVNSLAVRNYPRPHISYRQLLQSVKNNAISAFENQDVQFEDLVDRINPQRDPSRNPIFDVALVVQNFERPKIETQSLTFTPYPLQNQTSKFDITLYAFEAGDRIDCSLEYCTSLFRMDTIQRLAAHFVNILRQVNHQPHLHLADIDMLTAAEKKCLLQDFNDTYTYFSPGKTLHGLFADQAERTPYYTALAFNNRFTTYRKLDQQANQVAHYLLKEIAVQPDNPVAILMESSPQAIAVILGILKAGAVYLPIEPSLPEKRIYTMLCDTATCVMITRAKYLRTADRLQWACPGFHTYLCIDIDDTDSSAQIESGLDPGAAGPLMDPKLWDYTAEAPDEITAGGWISSYTGEPFTKKEMEEYTNNIFKKLNPLLKEDTRVLEIGCASGLSMYRLASKVSLYYGTDLSPVMIERNKEKMQKSGCTNIRLACMPAHEIDTLPERDFDLVILNSVIQCFPHHRCLSAVLHKAVDLVKEQGYLFIGDVMDANLKKDLEKEMLTFQECNSDKNYRTKIDFSSELFVARGFFEDLLLENPAICSVKFSRKIHTIENELTKFRYDVLIKVDKHPKTARPARPVKKQKFQHDFPVLKKYSSDKITTETKPSHLAYVIYTSGSTGVPKAAAVEHRSVVNTLLSRCRAYGFNSRTTALQLFSYAFDGFITSLFTPLVSGGRVVLLPEEDKKDIPFINTTIGKYKITHFISVPALYHAIVRTISQADTSSLKVITLAGDRVLPGIIEETVSRNRNIEIAVEYGVTEAAVMSTIYRHQQKESQLKIGKPSGNVKVYILDRHDHLQPIGIPGQLCITGPGLARGYVNQPELTAEKFDHDFWDNQDDQDEDRFYKSYRSYRSYIYRTGDLARWLSDGNIEFLGRIDHQVKIRGFRIEPGEIENQLAAHPHIKDAVVVTTENKTGDKYLCAYIVTVNRETSGKGPAIPEELKQYLGRSIPDYMVPTYFVPLEKIPLTPNGKIDRKRLPAPGLTGIEKYIAPQNQLQKKLAEIWAELLGIAKERIGIEDNFFDLGGHSLKATIMTNRIHKELNIKLPLARVFKTPFIKELAAYIKNIKGGTDKYTSLEPVEKKEYYPVSSAQKRLYILYRLEPGNTGYNMPQVIRLEEETDKERLEKTFRKLITRHESLRTSFITIDDKPVQRIHDQVEFEIKLATEDTESTEETHQSLIYSFDLNKAPLLRVELVKTSEGNHFLFLDMHHIITDGTSQAILQKEFMALYTGEELLPLKLQYKDFSKWQNSEPQEELLKPQESYWLKAFPDDLPVLDLPTDYPRPLMQSFAGRSVDFVFNEQETQKLRHISKETGTTLYMLILSIYTILLAKLSGQEDIIVGTPIAARRHADLEHIIGMLVNTLAIRNFPCPEKSGKEFIEEIKVQTLEAYENQEYQFEDLVEKLSVRRDTSRNPIFDVMFNLLNQEDYSGDIQPTDARASFPYRHRKGTAKFDLNLAAIDLGNRILFHFEYCSKLFKSGTIDKIIGYFRNIAAGLEINNHFKLSTLDILSEEEKVGIINLSMGAVEKIEPGDTIHRWFETQAAQTPDHIAVVGPPEGVRGLAPLPDAPLPASLSITYNQLNQQSNQLAKFLREQGVSRDTVVGLMVERSVEMIIGILAVLKAGGAYLPIDAQYPNERKKYMLLDSRVNLLLTNFDIEKKDYIPENIDHFDLRSEKIYHREGTNPGHINRGSDLLYVIYTSGSTGKPKGVLLKHGNPVNLFRFQYRYTNLDCTGILQFAAFGFDVSFQEIFTALLSSGTLYLPDKETRSNIPQLFKFIDKNEIKTVFLPMSFLKLIFQEEDYFNGIPACIDHILTAGEQVIINDKFREYLKKQGVYLHNHYGPSETHVVTTLTLEPREHIPRLPPIGKPVLNTGIYILDKSKHLLPKGVPGELYIGGTQVGRGYLNRPELTAERFDRIYTSHLSHLSYIYQTGDLAKWLSDGNIQFLGRIDLQVKIRGFRVEPGEIENRLLNHEAVKEAVVTAGEEENKDKYLCAYIIARRKAQGAELRTFLAKDLPDYMIPSYFVFLEKIPLTPSGKIDRKELPAPGLKGSQEYTAPQTPVETKLAEIWSEVLGIEKKNIGIHHNFFELGGHSLKATIMTTKIHKELNVKLPLAEIFKTPKIRDLAQYIKKSQPDIYEDIQAVEKKDYYSQSSAQKRLFFLDQFEDIGITYNMPAVYKIRGTADKTTYENTFNALIKRHETLRTSFHMKDHVPVQRVHDKVVFEIEYDHPNEVKEEVNSEGTRGLAPLIRNFIRPFDLSKAPLLRIGLIKLGENESLLLFDIHHIIDDGTSITLIINEFFKLYDGKKLPPLGIRYKDFSTWQNNLFETGGIKSQEDFWLNLYKDAPNIPRLNLPLDYPRPPVMNYEGDLYELAVGSKETLPFKDIGSLADATLYINLLAAFNVLLWKYTNQEDIIVGSAVAGRPHASLQNIIGMFVNMLAMRNHPKETQTYLEFLKKVKENCVQAFENQDFPFEELVDQLELERDTSRNPLFNVSFVVQNMESPQVEVKDAVFTSYKHDKKTSNFDMSLHAYEVGDEIYFRFFYYTRIFKRETIEQMARHLEKIIAVVGEQPGILLSAIDLLSAEEKHRLLYDFNHIAEEMSIDIDYFEGKTINRLYEEQVEKTPNRAAVVFNHQVLTYRELDQKTNQLANYLCRETGTGTDREVGILMDCSINLVTAILGICKAGGAYVPIDATLPEERIKHILMDAQTRVLISEKKYIRTLRRLQWECPLLKYLLCMDTYDIHDQEETQKSELMDKKLWEYVGETAVDDIGAGGWKTSYTGQPFTRTEMDEYADNALEKLNPLLNKNTRVLEIGCASGITMYRIAPKVGFYYGTDLSHIIIRKNKERVCGEGRQNIKLAVLPAHQIHHIDEKNFDIIIMNSVVQNFHGHNYLRKVIHQCIGLLRKKGMLFIGDIMDRDLKENLVREMKNFKQANRDKNYQTTTDFSAALFLSRAYFQDLAADITGIQRIDFSRKIYTIENELTKFRYDACIYIDKSAARTGSDKRSIHRKQKHRCQHDLKDLAKYSGEKVRNPILTPGHLAYVIYTSGSTGKPKGVMVEHRNVAHLVSGLQRRIYYYCGENHPHLQVCLVSPYMFDASVKQIFGALLQGHTLHIVDEKTRSSGEELLAFYQKNGIQISDGTPAHLQLLLEGTEAYPAPLQLENFLVGGEVLPQPLARDFLNRFSFPGNPGKFLTVTNVYGPTECTVDATFYQLTTGNIPPLQTIPIGIPLPNVRVYITGPGNRKNRLQPLGVPGELCIAGEGVARGYLNQPELTAEKFCLRRPGGTLFEKTAPPGPPRKNFLLRLKVPGKRVYSYMSYTSHMSYIYRTGDLARWLQDGNILFLGRLDDQVKIRGFRIELGEIEHLLQIHDNVKEAAVTLETRKETGDNYICAYIVPAEVKQEVSQPDVSQLKEYLSMYLPGYMLPAYFIHLDNMPLGASGKTDRRALPLPDPLVTRSGDYTAPANPLEVTLAAIWSKVLGIEKESIGSKDDFFKLGGHSLRATILATQIHREFHVKIPLGEIFKTPTIKSLARCIQDSQKEIYKDIKAVEKREYYLQSSAQKRLFFLDHFKEIGTSYNMTHVFGIKGPIEKKLFEMTFQALINRHQALRTSFHMVDNEPVQRVHDKVEFEIEYLATENTEAASSRTPHHSSFIIHHSFIVRPFDLTRAPLLRVGLIKISTTKHYLVFDMHHIVGDGTSIQVLVDEFVRLYDRETGTLPRLRIQYKDFSGWQNHLYQSGAVKARENYWLNLYRGEIPRLNLPTDYPRPEVFTFTGDVLEFELDTVDTQGFKALAAREGTTSFMNLLAVLDVLLYKYTGQDDMIIGASIAGRPHADLHHIIGMFVNELAIRNYPKQEKTFLEFLKEVKISSLAAFENQDLQFEELVDRLNLQRNPARNPLFDICLSVANFEPSSQQVKTITITPREYPRKTSKFDITLFAYEARDKIYFKFEYCTSLYKRETMEQLALHFVTIIRQTNANPGTTISDIDILSAKERKRFCYDLNQTAAEYPKDKTLHGLFEEQVKRTPDHTAVMERKLKTPGPKFQWKPGLTGNNVFITYEKLNQKANQMACYLYREKGTAPEQRVGILANHSIDMVAAVLGTLKAGAAYVPLEASLPQERLRNIIDDAGIGIVISQKNCIRILNRLQWECQCLHTFLCQDSYDIYRESELQKNELMEEKLWDYVAETAVDDITGGGWLSSYTGEPFSRQEMDEYANNILKKLTPLLHKKMRVLEIGCASGITMYRIAPHVESYYGIDLSPVMIEKNKQRLKHQAQQNIVLSCLPAHQIDTLPGKDFDLVILNSVIQSFHGHNYLRQVIRKIVQVIGPKGYVFIGDIMDRDLKKNLAAEMIRFKQAATRSNKNTKTKTDWSSELFVSRSFFEDLTVDIAAIREVSFSRKIYTIENELNKFRCDCLLRIDKTPTAAGEQKTKEKHKYQEDAAALARHGVEPLPSQVKAGNTAYIIYTSGTTGTPKGVIIRHRSLVNYLWWGMKRYLPQPHHYHRYLFPLYTPLSFDLTVTSLFLPLVSGNSIVVYKNEDDEEQKRFPILDIAAEAAADIVKATPSHLKLSRDKTAAPGGYTTIKTFIAGGEELETALARDINRVFPGKADIYNEYGPTEATVGCMIHRFDPAADIQKTVSIGLPVDNAVVYILDKRLKPVPEKVAGEICVGGIGLAQGYLNLPEATAQKFVPNPFLRRQRLYRTGDLGRRSSHGHIQFLGRLDDQVKIRGFRIELKEIENQLLKHEYIKETLVTAGSDPAQDLYLCAYIAAIETEVPTAAETLTTRSLREYLAHTLPDYMIPSYFVLIEKIPLTPNGKIDRRTLPLPQHNIQPGLEYKAPGNPVEEALAAIWSEVLGIEKVKIGIHDDFFELGGHSLKATTMITRIHKELNVKIPLANVFKTPGIKELGQYIKSMNDDKYDKYTSLEPVEKKEYYPVSSAQKRLYILHCLEPDNTVYNIPQVIRLEKDADKKRLTETFRKLIARHESLRTSFITIDDEPVQKIHDKVEFNIEYDDMKEVKEEEVLSQPFNLAKAPLLRVKWVKSAEGKHLLFLDIHHIITDGTSQPILKMEFMSFYAGEELSPLKLQYKDFSGWQNSNRQRALLKPQESYWLKVFPDDLPVLDLPTDYPRPLMQSFAGRGTDFIFNEKETQRLKRISRETGTTLYMVILSIYTILLAKLCGQEDIVVGTPIAARRHADLEQIIGMFVNTLAIRNFPRAEKSGKEFLEEVKVRTLQAFENQEYQFEDLVEKAAVRRDTGRNPIFTVMFNLLNQEDYSGILPTAANEQDSHSNRHREGTAKFDLNLTAIDLGNQLLFNLEYCSKLFKTDTIDKIIGYFRNTAAGLEINNHFKLSTLDILSGEEKAGIINLSMGTAEKIEPGDTIHHWFETQAAQTPDHISVVGPLSDAPLPASLSITYNRLNQQSNQLAKFLREQGVRRDTVVGLIVERSIEMIVGILAVLKAGGAYLPIDVQYPDERKKYMLRDSRVNLLLTNLDMEKTGYTPGNIHRIDPGSEDIYHGDGRNPEHINRDSDLLYMIYTSGSTGKPKGVLLEHRNLVNLFRFQYRYTNLDCTRILQFATLSFDASFHEIFSALLAGGTLFLLEKETRTNVPELFKLISKNEIKTVFLPMSFLKSIFQEEQYVNRIPACIDHIQTAGEQVIVDNKFREYLKKAKVYLHNHYGPSETHVATTLTLDPRGDIPQLPPIGKPVSNTGIYILDKSKHLLPKGVPGELYIGGTQVGRGYLNRPELTKEKFDRDLWDYQDDQDKRKKAKKVPGKRIYTSHLSHLSYIYQSGDLARWLPDGNIEFLGRFDHQVKIRGFRVEPGEIENRLLNHEAVKEAVVTAGEEENQDKYLCAYIVSNREISPRELREYLGKNLPDYMIPSYFVSLEKMPLNPSGKIDRKLLPARDLKDIEKYKAPQTSLEKKLIVIWAEALGIEKELIGIDHNFFELGGHSLKAIQLAAKMEKQGFKVSINQIFIYPTIGKLAEQIDKTKKEKKTGIRIKEPETAEKDLKNRLHIHCRLIRFNIFKNETPVFVLYVKDSSLRKIDEVLEVIRLYWDKEIQPQYIKEFSKMPQIIAREDRDHISLSQKEFASLLGLKKLK